MNKNVTLFSLLLFIFFSANVAFSAQSIAPTEKHPLNKHLLDVNQEWSKYPDVSAILENEIYFENDVQRIQTHLLLVEEVLRKRNVRHLTTTQNKKRQHHLDVLNAYWKKGIFPKNIHHSKRQPYFIDHKGTACAVGHLVREDGGKAFTEKIKKENNYAYISKLQTIYPEIKSWAVNNGFTLDELAWIQPGYPPAEQSWGEVGNGGGADGRINVMKTVGDKLYMAGDFSSVDGVTANSIIAWNGSDWETLGQGVEGEIFAIEKSSQNEVIIGGNFILNSDTEFSNIAMWDGNEWTGLQKGEMNGSVLALKWKDDYLYAGGDFENIDEQPFRYFAKRNIATSNSWNNNANTIQHGMEVNAPVRVMEIIEDKLLVGGEFTQTAPQITNGSINQLDTRYLAYWNDDSENWETEFDGEYTKVNAIGYFDEKIAIGGELSPADMNSFDQQGISFFENNLWNNWTLYQSDTLEGEGLIHGFFEFNEEFFTYGDVTNIGYLIGGQTYNYGFVGLYTYGQGGAEFDKQVRAVEAFQEKAYFVGDFTQVSTGWGGTGGAYNGLVSSPLDGINSGDENFVTKEIQIYHASGKLYVNYEDLENQADLNIYNLQGQILQTINLQKGAANEIFNLPGCTSGMYVYQIINDQGQQSGKFAAY